LCERGESMGVWVYGCMGVWVYGCMDVWVYGCMGIDMGLIHIGIGIT
jgi:hypothetical protein